MLLSVRMGPPVEWWDFNLRLRYLEWRVGVLMGFNGFFIVWSVSEVLVLG